MHAVLSILDLPRRAQLKILKYYSPETYKRLKEQQVADYRLCKKNYTRYKKNPEKLFVQFYAHKTPPFFLNGEKIAKYLCKYKKVVFHPELNSRYICNFAGYYGAEEVMALYTYYENDFYNGLSQSRDLNWIKQQHVENITFTQYLIYYDRKDVFAFGKVPGDHFIVLGIFWQDWWYYEYFLKFVPAMNIAMELVRVSKKYNKNCLIYLDRLNLSNADKQMILELLNYN